MGEGPRPAFRPRIFGAGARAVRGALPRDRPRGHPYVAGGEPRRPADAAAGGRLTAGRREGDPRGGGEGGQGRLPLPAGTADDREDGPRGGADPPVLRGPAREIPAAGPPRERDPAAARPRRGGRGGDRLRGERAGPCVGSAGPPAAAARQDALPPAGDRGGDPLLPAVRAPRPGVVCPRPFGPGGDPLQDEREGAVPGDRPRLLPERPDGLLRAGGTRPPQQRGEDGGARGGAGGGADRRRAVGQGGPEGGGSAPGPLPLGRDRLPPGAFDARGRALRRRAHRDRLRGDEPALRPPPAAGIERAPGGSERSALGPPLLLPDPHRPQRGGEDRRAEDAGVAHADGDGGPFDPRLPGFDRIRLPQPVRRGGRRAERGGGPVHLLRPYPAAERDPLRRGSRLAGAARRGRLGNRSEGGGGDRPLLPRNPGGPGSPCRCDDALRGTERDRLFGFPVRERLDGVRRGTPSAHVPVIVGDPRPLDGDGDRAGPRLPIGGSRAGERVPLRSRAEPSGGDRSAGAGARAGAQRSGGARREAQGGGGSRAAARRGADEVEGRGVPGDLGGAGEDAGGDPEGGRGTRPDHAGDAQGPEDRYGAEGILGDPCLEGEGARGGR